MKNLSTFILSLCAICLFTIEAYSVEIPGAMSYQAIIRNGNQGLVSNTTVGVRISILKGSEFGPAVYVERHQQKTNANGLLTLHIGSGTVIFGQYSSINWGESSYYLRTETDPNGGTEYGITSISPMLSVPYAIHSVSSAKADSVTHETDPVFSASLAATITKQDTARWNAKVGIEDDPIFKGSIANTLTDSLLQSWNHKLDSTTISDSMITAWSSAIRVELDSTFLKSPSSRITDSMITVWSSAIRSETDPLFTAWDKDYNDLINTPTINGSETKITAGNFIAVSGTGTSATPYVISTKNEYLSFTFPANVNTYTMPDGYNVVRLVSNNDNVSDQVTLPPNAVNGQMLYIYHERVTNLDNPTFNAVVDNGRKFIFVFINGNWILMSSAQ